MDDEELIRAVREGQAYAGPFLISLYAPRILGHVRHVAGDLGDEACELISENAVERALRAIDKYDASRGSLIAWIRSQVKFAALDYRRDHDWTSTLDGLDVPEQPRQATREMTTEVRAALTEAVRSLSHADQAILALIDGEGLTAPKAADLLRISHDAARQRLSRARRRLTEAASDNQILINFVEGRV